MKDTKLVRIKEIEFVKHNYIIHPGIVVVDTFFWAGDSVCSKPIKSAPVKTKTSTAVNTLMEIFRVNTEKHESNAGVQQVQWVAAQAQRMATEQMLNVRLVGGGW